MTSNTTLQLTDGDHLVRFAGSEEDLADLVLEYLGAAAAAGDAVIAIGGPSVLERLRDQLPDQDHAWLLDARSTLDAILVDGAIDPDGFGRVVGAVVRAAADTGRPVRAYGDMVNLLWSEGHVMGASELESLWTELAAEHPFALLCGYVTDTPIVDADLGGMCRHHTDTVTDASVALDADVTRGFPRSRVSPRLAREFAVDTLRDWDRPDLVETAKVVVSELVANAVLHAESDVSVGLSRRRSAVVVSVTDTGGTLPAPRPIVPTEPNGRGLHILSAAGAWTTRLHPRGKTIEIGLSGPLAARAGDDDEAAATWSVEP